MSVFRCISSFDYDLLCLQLLSVWDVGKSLEADVSSCLLFGHCKVSDYMYSIYFTFVILADLLLPLKHWKRSGVWCKPMCFNLCILMRVLSIDFCR